MISHQYISYYNIRGDSIEKNQKNKKSDKNNIKKLDKQMQHLLQIRLLSTLFGRTFQVIDNNNFGQITVSAEYIKKELDKINTNNKNDENREVIKNICKNKNHLINYINGIEELIYIFSQFYKYKNSIPYMRLEAKALSDKRVSMVLKNNVEYVADNLDIRSLNTLLIFITNLGVNLSNIEEISILNLNYTSYIITHLLKIKNKNILGMKNEQEIKYGSELIINEADIVDDLTDKLDFVYNNKKFENFHLKFTGLIIDIQKILLNQDNQNQLKPLEGLLEVKDIKDIVITQDSKTQIPFLDIFNMVINNPGADNESFSIELKTDIPINEIINKKKYAIGKNGAIIEFINKDKGVDSVEVIETDKDYYFKVKYIDCEDRFASINEKIKVQMRTNSLDYVFSYRKEVINKIIKTDDEKLIVLSLIYELKELNYTIQDSDYFVKNGRISLNERENGIKFKAQQGFLVLCCLYILYCDIKNKDVKVYDRKIEKRQGHTITVKGESYRVAYIRRLPDGYNVGEEALESAKRMGIILPEGYTFVNEHIPSKDKRQRVVRVRG